MPESADFDAFYAATAHRLLGQIYAFTGDLGEAEDAVAEAYARAWQRWSTVSAYDDPTGWVRTVAVRISVSSWRRARTRLRAHGRHGPPADAPELTPDRVLLLTALRSVSAEHRRVLRDVDTERSSPTSTPEPVPTARQLPTDSPAGTIIAIPEDVTVLFEDHEVTGQEGESLAIDESIARPWVLDPCTWSGYETDELRTDMRTVDFSPWLESFQTHQLAVYPNETVAVVVLEDFRSALGACRPDLDPAGGTQERGMASVTAPGYESYTVINCCTETVHTTAYAIVRQGNAVYVGLLSSEGGMSALTDVEGWAAQMAQQMCVFAFSC